ncbi:DNA repair protein rad13-like [Teratosphaeria destructans]|uniref:DNA repair protein rad13-like n=1 Tax=Teratosphaeria destructans TaxID=418781 RepID=A0A9W7SR95_9PEZI|nr:DNA repair protein rad13-like [Teratosphaeria destructans]
MGVTGLWQILQPCARPIKIETLNRKRLAVDASIWIYQFLKAVRDKEGNALRNSHVVGFFRRICKLLFFGIKPVFVFDGGAPALKRATINARKRRREGRREDAARTAGKLLAVQMQRQAEQDEARRKEERDRRGQQEEEVPDEGLVYVDELQMSAQERQQNRKFRKKDAYHLPELDVSMNEMRGADDPRVMSMEELEAYARQFDTGEDINVYDFSKIDYDSPFFMSLPASDRYNILNAARLRSRLRMGHSKEQLDQMFPDRMAFSKFQIERVTERNELTTRLMNINDGDAQFMAGGSNRVAGEKAREYVLIKNDGVEGGWALGVIGGEEGTKQEKAIDVDLPSAAAKEESSDEDEGFEDVPIEGLNRLPKRRKLNTGATDGSPRQRQVNHQARRHGARRRPKRAPQPEDPDSLFVAETADDEVEEDWEEVNEGGKLFDEDRDEEEDEDLRRAIAMSMEQGTSPPAEANDTPEAQSDDEENGMLDVFQQQAVEEARPVPKGSYRAIAGILNKRANASAKNSRETFSFGVPVPKYDRDDDAEEDTMDLQAALAESRRGKRKISPPPRRQPSNQASPKKAHNAPGFDGPLPFEKLDLGSSLLGKKKKQKHDDEAQEAGGFEHPASIEQQKRSEPLPPWFSGDIDEEMAKQRAIERVDREKDEDRRRMFQFQERGQPTLKRYKAGEVIDLDADDRDEGDGDAKASKVITLDDDKPIVGEVPKDARPAGVKIRMGDAAEVAVTIPPIGDEPILREVPSTSPAPPAKTGKKAPAPFMEDSSDESDAKGQTPPFTAKSTGTAPFRDKESIESDGREPSQILAQTFKPARSVAAAEEESVDEEEQLDWSESENEESKATESKIQAKKPAGGELNQPARSASHSPELEGISEAGAAKQQSRSASPDDFEDVDMQAKPVTGPVPDEMPIPGVTDDFEAEDGPAPASGMVLQETAPEDDDEFDDFEDPEEAELLKALATEAEEHARFASTLNHKSTAQNIADYEHELRQLRNQQKKDRRDADEVTQVMVTECQQLLRLFGLPYVTAPMEAEAQCAELVRLGLVDGINLFNQAKFVECYLTSDLTREFDLTRDKLIAVAQLLGSDYTEGLPGVGPVTAVEILDEPAASPSSPTGPAPSARNSARRPPPGSSPPPTFPDPRVEAAYRHPDVDRDPQPFQWGVPDLDALRSFLMATIGWSQERTDEVLVPVIRDMNRRADEGTQANLTRFFAGGVGVGAVGSGEAFAPRRRVDGSRRMGRALGRLAERARGSRGVGLEVEREQEEGGVVMPDALAAATAAAGGEVEKGSGKRKSGAGEGEGEGGGASRDEDEGSDVAAPSRKKKGRKNGAGRGRGGGRKERAAVSDE